MVRFTEIIPLLTVNNNNIASKVLVQRGGFW